MKKIYMIKKPNRTERRLKADRKFNEFLLLQEILKKKNKSSLTYSKRKREWNIKWLKNKKRRQVKPVTDELKVNYELPTWPLVEFTGSPEKMKQKKWNLELFLTKVNKQTKSIKLRKNLGHLHGLLRFLPAQAIEWANSVYSYNSNYNKVLFTVDNKLIKLIKSFLNIRFKRKQKKNKVLRAKKLGIPYIKYRNRKRQLTRLEKRLSVNKVFVAKGGVKHTGSKALITIFLWKKSQHVTSLINIKKLVSITFKKIITYWKNNKKINMERLTAYKLIAEKNFRYGFRKSHRRVYFKYLKRAIHIFKIFQLTHLKTTELSLFYLKNLVLDIRKNRTLRPAISQRKIIYPLSYYHKKGTLEAIGEWKSMLHRKITFKLNRHFRLFLVNEFKFYKTFLENFRRIASDMYGKIVILNFVKLNKYHLNSQIYSKVIGLKLKRREFSAGRVLTQSLQTIKMPFMAIKEKQKIDKTKLRINILTSQMLAHILPGKIKNIAKSLWFEFLLFKYDRIANPFSLFGRLLLTHRKAQNLRAVVKSWGSKISEERKQNLLSNVNFLKRQGKVAKRQLKKIFKNFLIKAKLFKEKTLGGIWVKASGRLTRRYKAARAVFKLKWIGGTRNVDSSYEGMSTVMLRGHALPNVESFFSSGKRRIGAFGLKVAVSSIDKRFAYSTNNNNNNNKLKIIKRENFLKHFSLKTVFLGLIFIVIGFIFRNFLLTLETPFLLKTPEYIKDSIFCIYFIPVIKYIQTDNGQISLQMTGRTGTSGNSAGSGSVEPSGNSAGSGSVEPSGNSGTSGNGNNNKKDILSDQEKRRLRAEYNRLWRANKKQEQQRILEGDDEEKKAEVLAKINHEKYLKIESEKRSSLKRKLLEEEILEGDDEEKKEEFWYKRNQKLDRKIELEKKSSLKMKLLEKEILEGDDEEKKAKVLAKKQRIHELRVENRLLDKEYYKKILEGDDEEKKAEVLAEIKHEKDRINEASKRWRTNKNLKQMDILLSGDQEKISKLRAELNEKKEKDNRDRLIYKKRKEGNDAEK